MYWFDEATTINGILDDKNCSNKKGQLSINNLND